MTAAVLLSPPPPIWHSALRTPVCRYGHPLINLHDQSMVTEYEADGLLWLTCRVCTPHTYALGVLSRYHALITYYAITREQLAAGRRSLDMPQLLKTLGYWT